MRGDQMSKNALPTLLWLVAAGFAIGVLLAVT